ncbi:hypothetical protein GGE12_004476 [Rhizobium mongolense]|uniref:Uncharacterized protein n=1 Tax=Rhizobium mongolense TaxID=57676 RepID=A0A7W6WGE4_9HYPH|nr:hypothetical protein [Rhizobium mongolense]
MRGGDVRTGELFSIVNDALVSLEGEFAAFIRQLGDHQLRLRGFSVPCFCKRSIRSVPSDF